MVKNLARIVAHFIRWRKKKEEKVFIQRTYVFISRTFHLKKGLFSADRGQTDP